MNGFFDRLVDTVIALVAIGGIVGLLGFAFYLWMRKGDKIIHDEEKRLWRIRHEPKEK